jgi:hypothetical protein
MLCGRGISDWRGVRRKRGQKTSLTAGLKSWKILTAAWESSVRVRPSVAEVPVGVAPRRPGVDNSHAAVRRDGRQERNEHKGDGPSLGVS